MARMIDRLSQRGLARMGKGIQPRAGATIQSTPAPAAASPAAESPLPTINQTIQSPAQPLTTTPLTQRLQERPERGGVGGLPQFKNVKKRFIADLPAKQQIDGIQQILAGQDSTSPIVNNFVKGMAARGMQPEEIRQAFIEQQKKANNPLVIL